MIAHRTVLSVLALVILCASGRADAAEVNSADDICAPGVDPCVITKTFSVANGALLDFGQRTVQLSGSGRLDGGSGSWTLNCGEFLVNVGTKLAIKARGPSGFGNIVGGAATINAFRQCGIRPDTLCVSDRDCNFGTCTRKVCEGDHEFACGTDVNCDLGACSAFVCTKAQTRICSVDADCSFGTCDLARRRCSNNSSVFCISDVQCDLGPCQTDSPRCENKTTRNCSADTDCDLGACAVDVCQQKVVGLNRLCTDDSDCFDGTCSVGTGTISINGKIRADGFEAGSVQIRGAGQVSFAQAISLGASGIDSDGGFLELESGSSSVIFGANVEAAGGGEGLGGEVCAVAQLDTVINAPINATGGAFDGGLVDITAKRDVAINASIDVSSSKGDGGGGEVTVDAGRNIDIANDVSIVADGHTATVDNSGGDGGTHEYTASGDFTLGSGALIQSSGAKPDGFGGEVAILTDGDVTIAGTIDVKSRGVDGEGGAIEASAGQALTVASTGVLDVVADVSAPGTVDLTSGTDMTYAGAIDAASTNRAGNSVFLDCGAALQMSGSIALGGEVSGGAQAINASLAVEACRINVNPGALVDNTGAFGDNTFTARETMTVSAGSSILADAAQGENEFVYRDVNKPPTISGTVTPSPTLTVDATLIGCPICGNSELEGGESCDDGNRVDGDGCSAECQNEGCLAATVAPGFPVVPLCSDGDGCTLDTCDDATSTCLHVVDCSDGIDCTVDSCDSATEACIHAADDALCDDGNPCTVDICNDASDCEFANQLGACDDGLACTSGDACSGGVCSGSSNCPDGQQCNAETGQCSVTGPVCGDGVVDAPQESCDDGDAAWVAGEYCNAQCMTLACGDTNDDDAHTASDALFTLRAAVGISSCDDCICNVDSSGGLTASDALRLLSFAVGVPGISLICPACA